VVVQEQAVFAANSLHKRSSHSTHVCAVQGIKNSEAHLEVPLLPRPWARSTRPRILSRSPRPSQALLLGMWANCTQVQVSCRWN